jgi:hypothetical protein
VPSRFRHDARYAVLWPRAGGDRGQPADRVGSLVDVWVHGADVVLFERGGSLHRTEVLGTPADSTPIELPGIGTGALVLGLRGNEVRVLLDGGEFVRITATLPPADLLELARGITEVPGGSIVELGAD